MSNPVLNSEGFERAAYSLSNAMQNAQPLVDAHELRMIVTSFSEQVTRLRDILGMQAENMQRAAVGSSMAYTMENFENI